MDTTFAHQHHARDRMRSPRVLPMAAMPGRGPSPTTTNGDKCAYPPAHGQQVMDIVAKPYTVTQRRPFGTP
jgi:hypothetical protein